MIKMINHISERANGIFYPNVKEVFDRANKYQNVISLEIGEPDLIRVIELLIEYLD